MSRSLTPIFFLPFDCMGFCSDETATECGIKSGNNSPEDTLRACFACCYKMDVYQPKYANIPMVYNITTPCKDGKAMDGKYGLGTVFSATNAFGQPEKVEITEARHGIVSFVSGGYTIKYTTTKDESGECQLQFQMLGPHAGRFQDHVKAQITKMATLIENNVADICAESPELAVEFFTPEDLPPPFEED